ncbi:hypothetical protein KSS87_011894 [Heliosperma pusillum]|nr:hypothetical protein KSS87_011894 [Heliosperma pusillum]
MDEELVELQKQFEIAQEAKSSIRLSERNVVELVQKLHDLHIIQFDLLHTVSGKEFITPEQLRLEIVAEVGRVGRVSLIDLADTTGVDLYHVEKQAQVAVSNDPHLMFVQGEIISNSYWDTVAEEINDRLQECSQIAVADLAAQLQVGSELVSSTLDSRLGTLIKGRLEGGQLYTPAYVARVNAMLRGSARGITVPMNLSALWSSLQHLLQGMEGATGVAMDNSFFQSLFNGLVKEVEILGSLRAGVHWTPAVFASAQKEFVDSFLSQNSFISYDSLHKLGIPQPIQYLQSRYPEGVPLITMFIHPSMIEMLDASVDDAIERNSWIDSLTVLPTLCGSQDAFKILSLCSSVQSALKSNKALIVGETYVLSDGFIKDVFSRLEKDMPALAVASLSTPMLGDGKQLTKESKGGRDSAKLSELNEENGGRAAGTERGSKKKKGKSSGNTKSSTIEIAQDNEEVIPTKSKKNQRKGKDSSASHASESKRSKESNVDFPSEDWIIDKILTLVPEFEEQGIDDREAVLKPLANHLRPMLLTSWNEKRKAMLAENSDRMKHVLDNMQKKLDESYLNMQLYEKALDLFDDDQATSVALHRHLLRTTGTSIVDFLLFNLDVYNKLRNGVTVEESQSSEPISLSSGEKSSLAKNLHGSLSAKASALVESLDGKRVDSFMTALSAAAEESGLYLRKLDKKLEKALVHSYRKDLTSQVSCETDPVSLLPKVVSSLYMKVYNKALQAPGRAMFTAVSRLKDKLDDSAYKTLMDYHSATVALLSLMSAPSNDEEGGAADQISSKKEFLESLMPTLKRLVLGTPLPQE